MARVPAHFIHRQRSAVADFGLARNEAGRFDFAVSPRRGGTMKLARASSGRIRFGQAVGHVRGDNRSVHKSVLERLHAKHT